MEALEKPPKAGLILAHNKDKRKQNKFYTAAMDWIRLEMLAEIVVEGVSTELITATLSAPAAIAALAL